MPFSSNFDLDVAPQDMEPHLRSKIFNSVNYTRIIYWHANYERQNVRRKKTLHAEENVYKGNK